MQNKGKEHMPTEKRYEINELTDTESTADAGHVIITDKMSSDFSCNQGKQYATLSLS